MQIDLERCRRGMRELDIVGRARSALIEEVIAAIQADRVNALRLRYFGIKNYAGFGDQREDHEYGFGPRHGTIVFSIGRTAKARVPGYALSDDAIYLLEAYRDFGTRERPTAMALVTAIQEFDRLTDERNRLADAFAAASIETHVGAHESASAGR